MNRFRALLFASALFSFLPLASPAHAQEVTRAGPAAYTVHLLPVKVRPEAPQGRPEPRKLLEGKDAAVRAALP